MPKLFKMLNNVLRYNIFGLSTRLWFASILLKYYTMKRLRPLIKNAYNYIEKLPHQENLIHNRDYDMLVILDACRYDVFSQVIFDYMDGLLIPVRSPASITIDWLKKVWGKRSWNDIVYVSASPMVNKRGLLRSFDARERFLEIIEVWDWGWDKELSTVPPNKVNFGIKLAMTKLRLKGLRYSINYKIIVHYVQPHAPYIGRTRIAGEDIGVRHRSHVYRMVDESVWLWRLLGRIEDLGYDINIIRRAYMDNLHLVLKEVRRLINHLHGTIIVTSDHGELLGEKLLLEHPEGLYVKELIVVPWLVIKKPKEFKRKYFIRLKISQKARMLRSKLKG